MDKSKKRWLIVLGIVLLIGLIILALVLGWLSKRGKAFDSRPLVLIHDPIFNSQFQVGEGVIVHATAREDNGLSKIELWVNDVLIDNLDTEEQISTNLVLFSTWIPTYEGEQQIIVRAISTDGIPGQSSIQINVIAADEGGTGVHLVEEGETLETISDKYDSSPDEIEDLNPGIGEGGPVPGDELIVPDDEPETEDSPLLPETDGDAPLWRADAPYMESPFSVFELFSPQEKPVVLRVEVPRLRTWTPYDGLHCYVGLAESLPQWYPDRDNNQATDESFGALGDGWWNTADTLVGDAAPLILWPPDQPLPATINCVGVAGGGTEAVELGQIALQILPDQWNGTRRSEEVDGEGGHLLVEVRVTKLRGSSRLTPKYLDPNMAVPTNLRLDEEHRFLWWDYPEDEEENIIGFEIFMNGNLIWTEGAFRRDSRMPDEWFRPPCASTYTFGVRAYRWDSERRDYAQSRIANFELTQPREDCVRQVQVTFLSLETFDIGGDGDHEDRHGDKGPAYGVFYANGSRLSFDHGHEGRGLDMPEGLRHNTFYDLAELAGDRAWNFDGPNSVVTDIPMGGTLRVGFGIMDRDTGRCRDDDDPGCNDRICRAVHPAFNEEILDFDAITTSTVRSSDGRCDVRFEIRPGPDSPVGVRGEGGEPLPWLEFAGYTLWEDTGAISLEIENTGTAGWSQRDLTVGIRTRDGDMIADWTHQALDIPVGHIANLHTDSILSPPYDFCIILDPYDEVLELHERTGNIIHALECPELPDLEVQDAYFEHYVGNRVRVFVQNLGPHDLVNRSLTLEVRTPDGDLLIDPITYSSVSFEGWENRIFEMTAMSDDVRERMAGGYTVTINPDHTVLERSFENNDFTVGEATRLSAYLSILNVPIPATDILEVHIDGYIRTGRMRVRQVVDFDISGDRVDWDCDEALGDCSEVFYDYEYWEDWFEIYGDEDFEIVINFEHLGTRGGGASLLDDFSTSYIYEPPTWNAGDIDPVSGDCHLDFSRRLGNHTYTFYDWADRRWRAVLDVCRENFGE